MFSWRWSLVVTSPCAQRRLFVHVYSASFSLRVSVVMAGIPLLSTWVIFLICCILGLRLFISRRDLKGQQGLE